MSACRQAACGLSVLIATQPRSGSWLLAEALENTGVCGYPREYFRADYQPRYARAWHLPDAASVEEYVEAVIRAGSTENDVFAAKFHWGQLTHFVCQVARRSNAEPASELQAIERSFPNARWIYLARDDKPRQAVSLYRAIASDVWWQVDDSHEPAGAAAITPDFAEIERLENILHEHESRWRDFFQRASIHPIAVTYAELSQQYEATVRRVLACLDLPSPAAIPKPTLRKQAGAASEKWLEAYLDYRRQVDTAEAS